jgi:hypothetical protein
MSHSLRTAIGPTIMAVFAAATISCLLVLGPGAPEVKAEPQSGLGADPAGATDAGPSMPLKGGACSRLAWPNYEQRCQFDVRPAAEMRNGRTVRIIVVR